MRIWVRRYFDFDWFLKLDKKMSLQNDSTYSLIFNPGIFIRWKAREMAQWRTCLMNCGRTYRAVPQDYGPESIERCGNTTKNKVELCGSVVLRAWRLRAYETASVIWFVPQRSDRRLFESVLSLEEAWWRLRSNAVPPGGSSMNSPGGERVVWSGNRASCHHDTLGSPSLL